MENFSSVFTDLLTKINSLGKRITAFETHEYPKLFPIKTASAYLINTTINNGVTYDSGNLRGVAGISAQARGFFGTMWITPIVATVNLQIAPGDGTPGVYSQQYRWATTAVVDSFHTSQMIMCTLGPTGNILIKADGANTEIFIVAFGYWE